MSHLSEHLQSTERMSSGPKPSKREELVAWLAEHNMPRDTKITCDECNSDGCLHAFDPYNINGDCLGDK